MFGRPKFYNGQKIFRTLWRYGFGIFRKNKICTVACRWPQSHVGGSPSVTGNCCLSLPERQGSTWRQSWEAHKQNHLIPRISVSCYKLSCLLNFLILWNQISLSYLQESIVRQTFRLISLRSIVILSSPLSLGLPNSLFPFGFSNEKR